jgi:Transglycosylase-like domain/Putative peptidoglycan binding domain
MLARSTERMCRESLQRSRARRAAALGRRRWRMCARGVAVSVTVATMAFGGVALASTGGTQAHRARGAALTLAPGSHGRAVAALQRALGITVTGKYDSATARAVRRFQAQNGLGVDGVAGPQTLAALGITIHTGSAGHRWSGDVSAELAKIAQCESGGDPQAVSSDGRFRGKYQFDLQTWRQIGGSGDPAQAPEATQDQLAAKLLRERGTAPWPNCA